ncbi:MAG: chitobiase/beta-hexosaminidase C-terminal domain-containing protein [Candidatus Acidiferrum sp.]
MRRPFFAYLSVHRSVFPRVAGAIAKAPHPLRRVGAVAIVCLTLLALGAACLKEDVLTRVWAKTPARPQASGGSTPTITSFDAPGAGTTMLQGTIGVSINAEGDIAGIYLTAPNVAHGFVRAGATGTITEFNAPDAGTGLNQGTFPDIIDTAGDIAGIYFDSNNAYHGFVRAAATGTITEFDATGAPTTTKHRGTLPLSINTAGNIITGFYVDASAGRHGFVRTVANGTATFTTFNVTGAGTSTTQGTVPVSVDTVGDVTGFYVDANQSTHGFVRLANGTITAPIDAPGAGTGTGTSNVFKFMGTAPLAIDSAGDITGVYTDTNDAFHGFVYTALSATPTFTTFDVSGAGSTGFIPGTVPTSVNPTGDIVGIYGDANGVNHGFLRAAATGTITAPLDAPGASTSGMISGTLPTSLNAAGAATGLYVDTNGVFHGFVLTPATTATPTFSPAAGTYASSQTVTISDATAGATIYYTTDGTTPTTASTVYSGTITVSATETIEAIAAADGFSNSAVASAAYTISTIPLAATPTFSPAAGTYTSSQTVTISDTTPGATIFYTTNGTTPTTASTVFSAPITVSSTETIEAIAASSGFSNSAVATAAYTINAPAPDFTLTVSPATLTIVAGQSGQAVFTVTPENGFNSKVSFVCGGLPTGAACSFNPSSVTPSGAPATSTLTVTTTAASAALQPLTPSSQHFAYAFIFPGLMLLFGIGARRRKQMLSGFNLVAFLALLVAVSGLASCSGSQTSGQNTGTPVGTSMVSVSASASGAAAVNHSATLTITITH